MVTLYALYPKSCAVEFKASAGGNDLQEGVRIWSGTFVGARNQTSGVLTQSRLNLDRTSLTATLDSPVPHLFCGLDDSLWQTAQ